MQMRNDLFIAALLDKRANCLQNIASHLVDETLSAFKTSGGVAQGLEQTAHIRCVGGSIPSSAIKMS